MGIEGGSSGRDIEAYIPRTSLVPREVKKRYTPEVAKVADTLHGKIGSAPLVHIVGEHPKDLSDALARGVYKDVEEIATHKRKEGEPARYPIFFLEFTDGLSDGLMKQTVENGHGAVSYEVSPRLLEFLTAEQASAVIANSMPWDGEGGRPSRSVEETILRKIYKGINKASSGQSAPDAEEEVRPPTRLKQVEDALRQLLDDHKGSVLEDDQKDQLDEIFTPTYKQHIGHYIVGLEAHVSKLTQKAEVDPFMMNADKGIGLFVYKVPKGLSPSEHKAAAEATLLAIQAAMEYHTPLGEPTKVVVATDKGGPDADLLQQFADTGSRRDVQVVIARLGEIPQNVEPMLAQKGSPLVILPITSSQQSDIVSKATATIPNWVETGKSKNLNRTSRSSDRGRTDNFQAEEVVPPSSIRKLGRGEMIVVTRDEYGNLDVSWLGADDEPPSKYLPDISYDLPSSVVPNSGEKELYVDRIAKGIGKLRQAAHNRVTAWSSRGDEKKDNGTFPELLPRMRKSTQESIPPDHEDSL